MISASIARESVFDTVACQAKQGSDVFVPQITTAARKYQSCVWVVLLFCPSVTWASTGPLGAILFTPPWLLVTLAMMAHMCHQPDKSKIRKRLSIGLFCAAGVFTYLAMWNDLFCCQLFNEHWFAVLVAAPFVWISWCYVRWG